MNNTGWKITGWKIDDSVVLLSPGFLGTNLFKFTPGLRALVSDTSRLEKLTHVAPRNPIVQGVGIRNYMGVS